MGVPLLTNPNTDLGDPTLNPVSAFPTVTPQASTGVKPLKVSFGFNRTNPDGTKKFIPILGNLRSGKITDEEITAGDYHYEDANGQWVPARAEDRVNPTYAPLLGAKAIEAKRQELRNLRQSGLVEAGAGILSRDVRQEKAIDRTIKVEGHRQSLELGKAQIGQITGNTRNEGELTKATVTSAGVTDQVKLQEAASRAKEVEGTVYGVKRTADANYITAEAGQEQVRGLLALSEKKFGLDKLNAERDYKMAGVNTMLLARGGIDKAYDRIAYALANLG